MGKKNKLSRSSINDGLADAPKGMRESLTDPNYKGEDYYVDDEIRNIGPLKNRGCSDCLFLIIFTAFFVLMGYITYAALKNGQPESLLAGVDSDGGLCGVDENLKDYGKVYYIVQADVTEEK